MRIAAIVACVLTFAGTAWAAPPWANERPNGYRFEQIAPGEEKTQEIVEGVFSELERRIIEEYFGKQEDANKDEDGDKTGPKGKSKGLPPGLAKRGTLPPGLARQVAFRGTLPPGLQKRDLPDDLSALLPERSSNEQISIVDDDVVLIERATGLLIDIIEDVVKGTGSTGPW